MEREENYEIHEMIIPYKKSVAVPARDSFGIGIPFAAKSGESNLVKLMLDKEGFIRLKGSYPRKYLSLKSARKKQKREEKMVQIGHCKGHI